MKLFFELIQTALERRQRLSYTPSDAEWRGLYELALRQTLLGILWHGVERLPREQQPKRETALRWFAATERIKQANDRLNHEAVRLAERMGRDGFRSVLLKGQGIARIYPRPELRTPGDIDIWLEGDRRRIIEYVTSLCPEGKREIVYHHIDFPILEKTAVEVHFTPSWMFRFSTNRRLQRRFREELTEQLANKVNLPGDAGSLSVPTSRFNLVYILIHIYRHLFGEGIGLRQIMDYYFVLRHSSAEERHKAADILASLRMRRFTSAMMYVQQHVFGLEEEYLLVQPDAREGKFLLSEIMTAGNFGHFDPRIRRESDKAFTLFRRRTARNLRFLQSYPGEVLWTPIFKIWHYIWRWQNGWLH